MPLSVELSSQIYSIVHGLSKLQEMYIATFWEGGLLENTYSASPVALPTRVALKEKRWLGKTGAEENQHMR